MSFWKSLALSLVCFCVLATVIGTTQARYPERFPDKSVVGQANHADDAPVCWGDDDDLCIEWDTDGSPDGGRITQKDCDGSPCDPLEFYKDAGANVVVIRASSVTNPDAKMTFGPARASSHTMTAGDSHFTRSVEISGPLLYVDGRVAVTNYGGVSLTATSIFIHGSSYISPGDQYIFSLHSDNDRTMVITDQANYNKSTGLSEYANPNLVIFSVDDPTSDNTKHNRLEWNRLALGGNGGGLGCINQTIAYDDFVDGGGASGTLVLDEGIPDGAVVQRAILHSLTGFTGDTSAFVQIGDGTDVDRYSTGTPSVFTTNPSGCELREPSGTAWHDDAKSVTVTITSNADFTSVSAGAATVAICYWTP
jgi:hypothetical protein